jgi:ankyrin repeat protein
MELLLAEYHMNPNLLTDAGQLALSLAKEIKTVEFLLRSERIDLNMLVTNGISALHTAVAFDYIDVLSCMSQSERVNPNILCMTGHSAFHAAVVHNKVKIVSRMLQCGRTDLNLLTSTGQHDLKLAKSPEMLQLLMESSKVISPADID